MIGHTRSFEDRLGSLLAPLGALLTPRRVRAHAIVAAASVWLAVALHYSVPALHPNPADRIAGDFYYFYILGVVAHKSGGTHLYDAATQRTECEQVLRGIVSPCVFPPTFYGPQVALALAPVSRLSYWWAVLLSLLATTVLYLISCEAIRRVCPSLESERSTVLVLAVASPAFLFLFTFGQNSALALACLTCAYLALRTGRPFLAGLAIGSLAYKPQLGLAAAIVFVAAREWRVVCGALLAAGSQISIGWLWFGTTVMSSYVHAILNVGGQFAEFEPKPYHMHSLRPFFSLLLPRWSALALTLYIVSAAAVLVWTIRAWRSSGPLALRFSLLLLASVLVDPHLYAYDLVVLAPALMLVTDWALAGAEGRTASTLKALVYLAYLLPLIGPLAILTRVQVSVVALSVLAYSLVRLLLYPETLGSSMPPDLPGQSGLRMSSGASFLSELLDRPNVQHVLSNTRNGCVVATGLEGAFDSASRRRGLLGRDGLPDGSALVIAPCSSIHTFFMRFPIDAVFMDRHGRVLKTYEAMPAWRVGGAWRAFAVIELPAGAVERSQTQPGDRLLIAARE